MDIEGSLHTTAKMIYYINPRKMKDAKEIVDWGNEVAKLRSKLLDRIDQLEEMETRRGIGNATIDN